MRSGLLAILALLLAAGCGSGGVGAPPTGIVQGQVVAEAGSVSATTAPALRQWPRREVRRPASRARLAPRLVVRLKPGSAEERVRRAAADLGLPAVRYLSRLHTLILRVPSGDPQVAASRLAAHPDVAYVEPDREVRASRTPEDPLYPYQWHYPLVGLPDAWSVTTGGPVIVAVVDSGVRPDHPDLAGVVLPGYDFVDDDADATDPGCTADPTDPSHGTHVAGTIAALTDNRQGVAGVVWGGASAVRILPVRVLGEADGECGVGYLSDVAAGILWAADRGAKVINLSLGGPGASLLQEAVQEATRRGVVVVAAAGNQGGAVEYPAAYPEAVAVGAVDCDRQRASYSNYGPQLDLVAPGGAESPRCAEHRGFVISLWWSPSGGHSYGGMQGTSMATPHVSGLVALLLTRGWTGSSAVDRLVATATDLGPRGRDDEYGWGLVDAARAIGEARPQSALRVFVAEVGSGVIRPRSSMASVSATGGFQIPDAQPGTWSLVAWQDADADGRVSPEDLYGRVDGVRVSAGQTTSGVTVPIRRYTGSPVPISP